MTTQPILGYPGATVDEDYALSSTQITVTQGITSVPVNIYADGNFVEPDIEWFVVTFTVNGVSESTNVAILDGDGEDNDDNNDNDNNNNNNNNNNQGNVMKRPVTDRLEAKVPYIKKVFFIIRFTAYFWRVCQNQSRTWII